MTLIRWNPVRDVTGWHPVNDVVSEFTAMQHDIDRMFDRWRGGILEESTASTFLPVTDIVEHDDRYLVHVEVPGVEKDAVKITVSNDVLTIKGEKKQEAEKKGSNYRRVERSYGMFQRSFTLPGSVKSDKIEASYNNGILTVSLPKIEEAKPRDIEVKIK